MLDIIAWILAGLSLAVILYIVIRKFPALAILDVDNIPGQKEAKFKEKIMRRRVERDLGLVNSFLLLWRKRIGGLIGSFLKRRYQRLAKLRDDIKRQKKLSFSEKRERIAELFAQAKAALSADNFEAAEKHLIEVISLDAKRLSAFLELGESYRLRKSYKEAKETFEHTLKLAYQLRKDPEMLEGINISEIRFSLARVCYELDLIDEALEYGRQALDAEPNNPRYLDLILDLSIMKKDKNSAIASWEKLAAANPENNKLPEWKAKIDALEE
ncbi:MAG: tetratricopeptide repeat protein [Bacillota bacterium]